MQFPVAAPEDVKDLQQRLAELGFSVVPDGIPGPQTRAALQTFQSQNKDAAGNPLAVDGIAGPATWASLIALAPAAALAAQPGQLCAGFDTAFYPGDAPMQAWKQSSTYSFVGYYLAAPAHPNASWMGCREKLSNMGWNLVVIYVGRQAAGPGSDVAPDSAGGHEHGEDALAKAQSEGFPERSIVYLDVEPMDSIPANMIHYVNAWLSEFAGKAYLPGIYCHMKNAAEIQMQTAQAAADISFWVTGGSNFTAATSRPTDSGIPFAAIWQGTFNQSRTFGGFTIEIDENVAFAGNQEVAATAGNIS